MILHGGLIARRFEGFWRGVFIQGASGVGKSDLALRAADRGFRLVADDRVLVFLSQGILFGRPPNALANLMEVRGLGVLPAPSLDFAEIALVARCVRHPDAPERWSDGEFETILGRDLPALDIWPLTPSAPAKLGLALERLGASNHPEYQSPLASAERRATWGSPLRHLA